MDTTSNTMEPGKRSPSAHLFRKNGRAFLFDPCTRTSFELDAAGEVAAREMLGGGREGSRVDLEQVAARYEFSALQNKSYFQEIQPSAKPLDPNRWWIPYPIISKTCNLRCRYCFVNHVGPTHMTREVMEATAVLIAERAAKFESSYIVWLGFVGESTTQFSLFDEFQGILKAEGRKRGVALAAHVAFTNATTTCDPSVRERLDEFRTPGSTTFVSLDGPPEAHDALRVHPDGRATYAEVIRGIADLRECGIEPGIEAAVSSLFPDISEVYFHLFELGIKLDFIHSAAHAA